MCARLYIDSIDNLDTYILFIHVFSEDSLI